MPGVLHTRCHLTEVFVFVERSRQDSSGRFGSHYTNTTDLRGEALSRIHHKGRVSLEMKFGTSSNPRSHPLTSIICFEPCRFSFCSHCLPSSRRSQQALRPPPLKTLPETGSLHHGLEFRARQYRKLSALLPQNLGLIACASPVSNWEDVC